VFASVTFECCVRFRIMSISYGTTCDVTRIPAFRLVPLQRVQNAAARLVLNLDRRAHISPALQQLHWLPVMHRVTFKIATLMHQILHKRCLSYLADLVTFKTTYSQRRHLRSSTTRSAAVRRVHLLFAVLLCGIVFLLHFVISTVIQFSGMHSSHIYLAVLFPHNSLLSHSFTDRSAAVRRVHLLFAVLQCGIVFLLHFVISHSFTDIVMHSRPYYVD